MPNSHEIRHRFIQYFQKHQHAHVPSSPVVPHDDPTLLFTNAGMNQFKDLFLGKNQRDYTRAVTAQKCIRAGGKHNDLDNVGHTSRHLTFFEMLGNFSFGDYFKKEAIQFAWEVSTQVFCFDPEKIFISIFETDDEAFELWKRWVPEKMIVRMGEADNFWSMGDTGPCGPCSELYYDKGEKYGTGRSPKEDVEGVRFLEFWNLVFMQFNRDSTGKMTPLPKQSIDTGSGLERVMSLLSGAESVFATDILRGLIAEVERLSEQKYDPTSSLAPAFHVIADHIRSLSFAIADGAQPSNIERGYVLRKLLRRAVRYGRMLGLQKPFLGDLLPKLVDLMGNDYRELAESRHRIAEIVTLEEEAFLRTLKKGGNILSSVILEAKQSPLKQIRGEEAFKLKDTYGLPLEEILLIAKDENISVNLESFQLLEEQAKEKSRSAHQVHLQEAGENLFAEFAKTHPPVLFTGYTHIETQSAITGLVVQGQFTHSLKAGEEGWILLNQTPFYAEKGGQVGDKGTLVSSQGHFTVASCQSPYPGIVLHQGKLERGSLQVGESVLAQIDFPRRELISHNHTATHLLHWALVQVLGPHVKQAGSLVDEGKIRFDFNHHKALSREEIRAVEDLVNARVRENRPVATYELTLEEVQKKHEIKQFFGDKYGATVRVVDIDFSKELCGGTHVQNLGVIGLFHILKESSVAAGVRRMEAVTGREAELQLRTHEDMALTAAGLLKTTLPLLPEKVSALLEENKRLSVELKSAKRSLLKQMAEELVPKIVKVNNIPFLARVVELDTEELVLLADDLIDRASPLVLVLATKTSERAQLLVRVSPSLVQKGIQAGALVKEIAPCIGGSGGGKGDSAQAGGKIPAGIMDAFEKATKVLEAL